MVEYKTYNLNDLYEQKDNEPNNTTSKKNGMSMAGQPTFKSYTSADLYDVSLTDSQVEPKETSGDVITGLKRGVQQTQAMGYGAVGLAGSAIGIDPVQKWGFEGYQRNIKEAEKYPKKHSFKDIYTGKTGIGGAIDWAQGTLGELVPSMVEAAIGATIGSFAFPGAGTAAGGLAGRTILKKAVEKTIAKQLKKGIIKSGSKEALEKGVNLATKKALKKF